MWVLKEFWNVVVDKVAVMYGLRIKSNQQALIQAR